MVSYIYVGCDLSQVNKNKNMKMNNIFFSQISKRNLDPPIWYDTDVKLFEIQRVKEQD